MSFIQPDNAAELYITQMQNRFQELADQLQEHGQQVDDPEAKVMFEKSSQVLAELVKVFSDFSRKNEANWQAQQNPVK